MRRGQHQGESVALLKVLAATLPPTMMQNVDELIGVKVVTEMREGKMVRAMAVVPKRRRKRRRR